ncbi:MAG: HD domain-containing protein, partial [Chloroflexi bacterium]|nr:HD domain-containing protein [Chloroflexota bacterium]
MVLFGRAGFPADPAPTWRVFCRYLDKSKKCAYIICVDDSIAMQDGLIKRVAKYLPADEVAVVRVGMETAVSIHAGYQRKNGEPYINHVVAVASMLSGWQAPVNVVVAGLLHDIYKTNYANSPQAEEIVAKFGQEIADLVYDISRLGRLGPVVSSNQSVAEDAAVQMPWVAMVLQQSPLAVVVKLVDKLHN